MKPGRHKTMYQQQQQQQQNLQNMNQSPFLHLNKLTQFIISFSLFSLLFLHPSWLPFVFHSFISHFSTFHSQILSLAADKNYIFLLCNGILVFIAKYSTSTVNTNSSIQTETTPDNELVFNEYSQSLEASVEKPVIVEEDDEEENRMEVNEVVKEEEQEGENGLFLITDGRQTEEEHDGIFDEDGHDDDDDDKECEKEDSESGSYIEEEEVEVIDDDYDGDDDDDGIAKMSTEELNRKFEDFIRKMKEELRIEAQQQLIMV